MPPRMIAVKFELGYDYVRFPARGGEPREEFFFVLMECRQQAQAMAGYFEGIDAPMPATAKLDAIAARKGECRFRHSALPVTTFHSPGLTTDFLILTSVLGVIWQSSTYRVWVHNCRNLVPTRGKARASIEFQPSQRPDVGFRDCNAVVFGKLIESAAEGLLFRFHLVRSANAAPEGMVSPLLDCHGFGCWRDI